MCIAIYQPSKVSMPRSNLKNGFTNNPDGAGFMFASQGRIHIYRQFKRGFRKFYKEYNKARGEYPESPFVIHFRWATHGEYGIGNVHPFQVHNGLAMVHNGILDIDVPKQDKRSDTAYFIDTVLKIMPPNFLDSEGTRNLLELYCGTNKLVFLDSKGKATIINEGEGVWDKGIWYSNDKYKPPLPKTVYKYDAYKNTYIPPVHYGSPKDREQEYCISCGLELISPREYEESMCFDCLDRYDYALNKGTKWED